MNVNEGPLQTVEHIFMHILEERFGDDVAVNVPGFDKPGVGILDVSCSTDLRELDFSEIVDQVHSLIDSNLVVGIEMLDRNLAEREFDLSRVPAHLDSIRVVRIADFDSCPCGDSHVSSTSEIGGFVIESIKRSGSGRYRITFSV